MITRKDIMEQAQNGNFIIALSNSDDRGFAEYIAKYVTDVIEKHQSPFTATDGSNQISVFIGDCSRLMKDKQYISKFLENTKNCQIIMSF